MATPAQADPVSDAYEAFQAGEYASARDLARDAIAGDPSVTTLIARKVLILCLQQLGDAEGGLAELEGFRAFDLVDTDVEWADTREADLRAMVAEAVAEAAPVPEVAAEAAPVPEVAAEAAPVPEVAAPSPGAAKPAGLLAIGGGFMQLGSWSYGDVGIDGGVRIVGPLWMGAGVDLGMSPGAPCSADPADAEACTALLTTVAVGPMLRIDAAVQPWLRASFLAALNGGLSPYRAAVVGFEFGGGIELGKGVIAARPRVALRVLSPTQPGASPSPGVLAGIDLALRLGVRK